MRKDADKYNRWSIFLGNSWMILDRSLMKKRVKFKNIESKYIISVKKLLDWRFQYNRKTLKLQPFKKKLLVLSEVKISFMHNFKKVKQKNLSWRLNLIPTMSYWTERLLKFQPQWMISSQKWDKKIYSW